MQKTRPATCHTEGLSAAQGSNQQRHGHIDHHAPAHHDILELLAMSAKTEFIYTPIDYGRVYWARRGQAIIKRGGLGGAM